MMHEFGFLILVISTLGFIILCKKILCFVNWVWIMFFRPSKNLKHYGSWAIVTGCTDGIGKSLSFQLASKGLNLILVGRNPSKLEETLNDIRSRFGSQIEIKYVLIDLAKSSGEEILKTVENALDGVDVGILVNNAGLCYPAARFFDEVDSELVDGIIKVNVEAVMWITRAVLPIMLKKQKGAVINIGSGSSGDICSFPLYTVYAASKTYIAMLSRSLNLEYKKNGIDIQCQVPLFVATKMTRFKKTSLFIPSADKYSKSSLRWIGYEHLCVPYWPHSVQWFILSALPDWFKDQYFLNYFMGMRKRTLQNTQKFTTEDSMY